ncbi:hypothetical protein [Ciceribacter sp. L1K22]|uniref:hypothetical protein n=1 Tax=Ciceribacter sp. L1K22 TaxID=2820275 RepID=UPI001ABEA7B0|nr:hypothetical protein [Ciceribacter sp. L1K22]MBO3759305.1 hypothetical protein [Ciceribacter sp. L1K22]
MSGAFQSEQRDEADEAEVFLGDDASGKVMLSSASDSFAKTSPAAAHELTSFLSL